MGHETLLTIFIIIAAAAIVMQGWAMLGVYRAIEKLDLQVANIRSDVKQRLDPLAQVVTEIAVNSREPLRIATANFAEISQILRERAGSVDALLDEVVDRTRLQIIRIDQTISDILAKAETTSSVVQKSVLGPIQEVSAVVKGVRSGLEFLFSRRRNASVTEAAQDEQMFI